VAANQRENEGMPTAAAQFASDVILLVRTEIDEARSEMAQKAKSAGVGAGMLSGSAIAAIFSLASLTALIMVALSLVLPLWASMLITTALWGAAAAILAMLGKKKVEDAAPFVPEQTIANIKEDVEWARGGGGAVRGFTGGRPREE
jgi:uncharacterized membrane protein YqjE